MSTKPKDKKMPLRISTCNQCHKQMEYHADFGEFAVPICANPACPNYALLQISAENMPKEKE